MNQRQARQVLDEWDRRRQRHVYTHRDLAKLFPEDSPKTLQAGINRLVATGTLIRAARGIYVYALAKSLDSHVIERVAKSMRRGEYNYVSLESALSEYGAISQVPVDRLTVMTTGRKGAYRTPYGTIEFTHTKRPVRELIDRMVDAGRPLRVATLEAAWGDLKRVGRNTHLVDLEGATDE